MNVVVNGEVMELPDGATVEDIVARVLPRRPPRGVAVAVNGEVVARTDWKGSSLSPEDRIDVLAAIGGG